ncbi:MAG: hypothetical protein PQ612_00265 [Rickettsiales bacterium]|nr:hypothetical protein [Pseudomonadota bacterium]MDA0965651.1 hypothetical protein [Pseudomonadota bacterium]MDG4542975.1 hypothetical protein [Rickettsiales bacterium]MDG4544577.1 hypothetical protein [Rickettsiales bacterium]MDG4546699.1 hypothetical protein [Rickettsiales bacterium]
MKSLKNIAPILLATNPDLVSAFSSLSGDKNLPDKNKIQNSVGFVEKTDIKRKKWGFMDGLEDKTYSTTSKKNNTSVTEDKPEIIQGVVCKDGVCYLSFGDEKNDNVQQNHNDLFVVDDSSSFVNKYTKTKDDNQGMQR